MTLDRYLCDDCKKTLQQSQLKFKRITNYSGECICAWCGQDRSGYVYRIKYGGRVKSADQRV